MKWHCRRSIGRLSSVIVALVALATLTLVFALTVGACGSGTTDTTASDTGTTAATTGDGVQVIMTNRSYDPATVTISVGQTVTWVNQDAPQHDVIADNGEFSSPLFDKGQTFGFTFTKAGTYPYHCSIHPGMTGTVIVQ